MRQWMKNQSQKATWKNKLLMWCVVIVLGMIRASIKDANSAKNDESEASKEL